MTFHMQLYMFPKFWPEIDDNGASNRRSWNPKITVVMIREKKRIW